MRSKILVYFPSKFFDSNQLAFQCKQIKELGFEQVVLGADFVLQTKNLEKLLLNEKISIFAIFYEDFSDANKSMLVMESAHSLNCPYILSNIIPAKESDKNGIQKMEESGLTILEKIDQQYFKKNETEPLIIQNPLAYSEKPLQSSIVTENETESKIINGNKDKNIFFMIAPDGSLERSNYLRHCKDILNRYFFLGLR
jgi:hypothetical protein